MAPRQLGNNALLFCLGLLVVVVVGSVDALTGPELSFGIFYLIPIAWVSWRTTRREGTLLSLASALTWYAVETLFGRTYSWAFAPVWNATVRFGFFILVALLLTRVRVQLDWERVQNSELNRLNQALDGYAAHVAHDLRGPLSNISMAVRSLDPESLGDQGELVAIIYRSTERGIQLTEDLLVLAKASATPAREPVDLSEMARIAAADIEGINMRLEEPLHVISADRVVLRQCLENLFRNASRYGRAGDDTCAEVTVSSDERPDGWVVTVADRGPGLSAEDVEGVFNPFVRGAGPGDQGTGLGLAIVAAAAAGHGGEAWYEPREGGGSKFRILIGKPPESPHGGPDVRHGTATGDSPL